MSMENEWEEQRSQIIGLGENSFKKSYYPELQQKISEVESSYANLHAIFNTIHDGIVIHDESGKLLLLNIQSQKIFNISEKEKDNFSLFSFSSPKNTVDLHATWQLAMSGESKTIDWVIVQFQTNTEIYAQVSINSAIWYGEKVLVGTIRDISDRIKFENELIKAKEKAEESDRLKSAFLQNMSHEIRTPMNAICGFSSFLSDPDLSEEKRKNFVSIIQNSSNQLLSIVNDILTISSLETKQEKINIQKVCINSIIIDLFSIFKQQATKQNITLYNKQQLTDKQSEVLTDSTKVTQILTNLLTNALKFTHNGSVEFGYQLEQSDSSPFLKFYVKDSGIGIAQELHEKIFERFRQADTSISRKYGGTGLGLSISKAFVELLGGQIWVESLPGTGSTFYFTIPYKPSNENIINEIDNKQKVAPPTIVVAEDEEFNFLYIEELLSKHNCKLIHTKNGAETVNVCKANPDIALILMDIRMPVMDGFTAAKLIKELAPSIPIIAQTAYALEHEIEKFSEIFDNYLTKPINKSKLIDTLKKYQI